MRRSKRDYYRIKEEEKTMPATPRTARARRAIFIGSVVVAARYTYTRACGIRTYTYYNDIIMHTHTRVGRNIGKEKKSSYPATSNRTLSVVGSWARHNSVRHFARRLCCAVSVVLLYYCGVYTHAIRMCVCVCVRVCLSKTTFV